MSYGIEVFDSAGATVFNSTHFVELACFNATVVGTDASTTPTGSGLLTIPDYCFGDDQHGYFGNPVSRAIHPSGSSSYSNNNQIASPVTGATAIVIFGTTFVTPNAAYTGAFFTMAGVEISEIQSSVIAGVTNGGAAVSDYDNAYYIYTTDANMVSYRTDSTIGQITESTDYATNLVVYARPNSSSYNGHFRLYFSNRKIGIIDMTNSNNTFEIMVTVAAEEFGSITSTTAHKLAGDSAYGVVGLTDTGRSYTAKGPTGQYTTFDSGTYLSKVLTSCGYSGGTAGTNSVKTIGSLTTSTVKRYARVSPTILVKKKNAVPTNELWFVHYKWYSNSQIELWWRQDGNGFVIEDTMVGNSPYAVVEFGDGL